MPDPHDPEIAFVLGGGGYLGGYQAGMARALIERGIIPDLVIGTSAGSVQGALLAADPSMASIDKLVDFWLDGVRDGVMKVRVGGLLANAVRLRPALASSAALRDLLERYLGATTRIEDLAVPYQCCAASIERASARYFDSGPLVPAVLASCSIPGLWPPVTIGDETYVDGGVVETIPVGRAIAYAPKKIYVLRLRQREPALQAPRFPWQLGKVIFEVSRRHKLAQTVHARPDGVEIHLIPTGEELLEPPDNGMHTSVAEQLDTIRRRIDQGYRSACDYLDDPSGRRSATVRPEARHQASEPRSSGPEAHGEVSELVAGKIRRYFDVLNQDQNGLLDHGDIITVADRIARTFGHDPGSRAAADLRDRFDNLWNALCTAAEVHGRAGLSERTYQRAMIQLTRDPATYDSTLHPVTTALLDAADVDHDQLLSHAETQRLVIALGAQPADARRFALRLDTNGDGVISIDELDGAFRDYFTSTEPNCAGNLMFGAYDL